MADDERSLTISRRLGLAPAALWRLLTEPAGLARWWWPARLEPVYEVDLRVGGAYRFTTPDGAPFGSLDLGGEFVLVDAPHRLEYTWRWAEGPPVESRVALEIAEDGVETVLVVTQEGLADAGDRDNHVAGWNDCLDRLAALAADDDR
jgi:uncharacterized protein YndB with AHSA1/START domain